jgi:hypothetical protein
MARRAVMLGICWTGISKSIPVESTSWSRSPVKGGLDIEVVNRPWGGELRKGVAYEFLAFLSLAYHPRLNIKTQPETMAITATTTPVAIPAMAPADNVPSVPCDTSGIIELSGAARKIPFRCGSELSLAGTRSDPVQAE